jgi:hypothetical protein
VPSALSNTGTTGAEAKAHTHADILLRRKASIGKTVDQEEMMPQQFEGTIHYCVKENVKPRNRVATSNKEWWSHKEKLEVTVQTGEQRRANRRKASACQAKVN